MKFLNDPQLQALTNCLANREIGDVLLEGKTEVYSLKSGQADKKFARELEAQIASEAAHRRERSASFSFSRTTTANTNATTTSTGTNEDSSPTASSFSTTQRPTLTTLTSGGNVSHLTVTTGSTKPVHPFTNLSSFTTGLPNDSPSYTDDEKEEEDKDAKRSLSLPTSPLLRSTLGPSDNASSSLLSPRTLFILINTLNNSYPDYDFSDLRSHNFLTMNDIQQVYNIVNTSLSELAIEENRYPTLPQEMEAMVRARQVSTQQIALANNTNSSSSSSSSHISASTNATIPSHHTNTNTGSNNTFTASSLSTNVPSDTNATKRKRGRPSANEQPPSSLLPVVSSSSSSSHSHSTKSVPLSTTVSSHHTNASSISLVNASSSSSSSNTGTFFLDTYWSLINSKINIPDCEIYSLLPDLDSDPLSEDAIWSFNFFFLNRTLNRIVYIACVAKSTAYTSTTGTRNTVVSPLRRIQASPDNDTTQSLPNHPSTKPATDPSSKKTKTSVSGDNEEDDSDNDGNGEEDISHPHTTPEKRTLSRFPMYDDDAMTEPMSVVTEGNSNGGGDDQSSYISSQAGRSSSTTLHGVSLSRRKGSSSSRNFPYLHPSHRKAHGPPYRRSRSEMYAGGIQGAIYDDQEENNDVSDDLEYIDDEDDKFDIDTVTNNDDDDDEEEDEDGDMEEGDTAAVDGFRSSKPHYTRGGLSSPQTKVQHRKPPTATIPIKIVGTTTITRSNPSSSAETSTTGTKKPKLPPSRGEDDRPQDTTDTKDIKKKNISVSLETIEKTITTDTSLPSRRMLYSPLRAVAKSRKAQ